MRGAAILLLLLGTGATAFGQDLLRDAEDRLAVGDHAAAADLVSRWWARAESGPAGSAADRARALFLRARLSPDPATAERDYIAVVLTYPTSARAPEALLRLGQLLLLGGENSRANVYLERLVNDYPGNRSADVGYLWLARARIAARQTERACDAARRGLALAGDSPVADMLRHEERFACADSQAGNATAESRSALPAPRFAVQVGAFRQQSGADNLVQRLRRAGFQPRVVRVPDNALLRVRVGRFTMNQDAEDTARRLRRAGFDAILVQDAHRER